MISVDFPNKLIFVPTSYLTYLAPNSYSLDVNAFRLDLKGLEELGMPYEDAHEHKTTDTLSGTLYPRFVKIINGYEVEFENGTYQVRCFGAEHNLGDVKVINSVSLIIANSAGNTVTEPVTSITEGDLDAIDAKVDPTGKLKKRLVLQKGEEFDIEVEG
jgi:hypothetical protein